MSEAGRSGLLDLEKELTCSICTEILYQPLTLLDCLHTFCGSCVQLWFTSQASSNPNRRSNPYNCPSCRDVVRGTRPDAKINTLLEMYLRANPSQSKSQEEKDDIATKYKPGDDVIPRLHRSTTDSDEDDWRMVEEVREMSLREGRTPRGYERGTRHRPRSNDGGRDAPEHTHQSSRPHARDLEHQSSLRSLISSSEIDSHEMEEEILRQIAEEGLLDGIDLQNLDERQQDELSERIAEAYRRRHGQRRSQDSRRPQPEASRQRQAVTPSTGNQQTNARRHARSSSANDQTASTSSRPPVSRPHLFEAYPVNQGHGHHRRASSETRRQTSPATHPNSVSTRNEASRSSTDVSQRPRRPESQDRRSNDIQTQGRRSTDSRPRRLSETRRASSHPTPTSITTTEQRRRDSPRGTTSPMLSPTLNSHTSSPQAQSPPLNGDRIPRSQPTASPRRAIATLTAQESERSRPSSSSSANTRSRATTYPEPSISCNSCGKADIQYDLHANCEICHDGKWNVCQRCYRLSKGCLHYYGFGNAAWYRYQQRASPGSDLPHVLVGKRYQRPPSDSIVTNSTPGSPMVTINNPEFRLISGAFCYVCNNPANECFWTCSICNEGEWGYCNSCVNTGRICTHPLLPLAHVSAPRNKPPTPNPAPPHSEATFAPLTSPNMVQQFPPSNLRPSGQFRPLAFSIMCSICSYPISPNQSRYHCYVCDSGDYDACNTCYAKACDAGRISRDDGDKGWRRCLKGHRMVVYYFDDSAQGQRRVVVRDLVGGHLLKDKVDANGNIATNAPEEIGIGTYSWIGNEGERQSTTLSGRLGSRSSDVIMGANMGSGSGLSIFPPDGGFGMIVIAMHTWLPADGVEDELSFPRHAEIREARAISNDWYHGSYAGMKGLFPSSYVKVLETVGY